MFCALPSRFLNGLLMWTLSTNYQLFGETASS
jgi:hypothetical protein